MQAYRVVCYSHQSDCLGYLFIYIAPIRSPHYGMYLAPIRASSAVKENYLAVSRVIFYNMMPRESDLAES